MPRTDPRRSENRPSKPPETKTSSNGSSNISNRHDAPTLSAGKASRTVRRRSGEKLQPPTPSSNNGNFLDESTLEADDNESLPSSPDFSSMEPHFPFLGNIAELTPLDIDGTGANSDSDENDMNDDNHNNSSSSSGGSSNSNSSSSNSNNGSKNSHSSTLAAIGESKVARDMGERRPRPALASVISPETQMSRRQFLRAKQQNPHLVDAESKMLQHRSSPTTRSARRAQQMLPASPSAVASSSTNGVSTFPSSSSSSSSCSSSLSSSSSSASSLLSSSSSSSSSSSTSTPLTTTTATATTPSYLSRSSSLSSQLPLPSRSDSSSQYFDENELSIPKSPGKKRELGKVLHLIFKKSKQRKTALDLSQPSDLYSEIYEYKGKNNNKSLKPIPPNIPSRSSVPPATTTALSSSSSSSSLSSRPDSKLSPLPTISSSCSSSSSTLSTSRPAVSSLKPVSSSSSSSSSCSCPNKLPSSPNTTKISSREKTISSPQTNSSSSAKPACVLQDDFGEDFQCCICQELMIHAHVLECSHTFCEHCILSWLTTQLKQNGKQKGSQGPCPVCRAPIVGGLRGIRAVDNHIDKLVRTMLTAEERVAREKMVAEVNRTLPGLRQTLAKANPPTKGKARTQPVSEEEEEEEDEASESYDEESEEDHEAYRQSSYAGTRYIRPFNRVPAPLRAQRFQYHPEKPQQPRGDVCVEYARSGHAKCKECQHGIPDKSLRFKIGSTYYHIHCLAPTHRDGSLLKAKELVGMTSLTRDDQAVVHAMLD